MKHIGWVLAFGGAALATIYVLGALDWFHDDADDYTIFESHRSSAR